jgi:hypothetical protein
VESLSLENGETRHDIFGKSHARKDAPMKPTQPQLPAMPRDYSQPVECRGLELAAVIAEGHAAGYHAHRMRVLPDVIYELQFFRLAGAAEAGKTLGKESFYGFKASRRYINALPKFMKQFFVKTNNTNEKSKTK